ncbi:unannotated protein [freshwater metagenome]|uniref:Unannotated protein n=1 Tax=freshwater metagenome TaxID=449393 RepID=A0A6J7RB80_9ZZZZ|nr:hypothetical protein [Actinomycetota bacterium]MSW37507.1 hypothetical protein [Actinomycetota bacterium]MSX38998.1 hypothetical protein [Actinomycetota bacterium]
MEHVRIATFDVREGLVAQVAEPLQGPGGLIEIFSGEPGFRTYALIEVDPVTCISVSVWESHEEAEHATNQAAEWVATHMGHRVHRTNNVVGDALFWVGVASEGDASAPLSAEDAKKMNHVRIATYEVVEGVASQVAEVVRAPGGMVDIWKAEPGFRGYTLIEIDPLTLVSVSVWETHDEAEHATRQAAEWVVTHLGSRVHRTANAVGDAVFWVGAGGSSAA